MRIHLLAVGRLKAGAEADLTADYVKRAEGLGRTAGLSGLRLAEIAESRAQTAPLRKQEEARALLAALPSGAHRAVLDERGKAIATEAFAAWLRQRIESGTDLCFLIGGPDGHDPALVAEAGTVLSLGPMTWPHRLVRVMLAEQIYRAVTIMVNHPYHRP